MPGTETSYERGAIDGELKAHLKSHDGRLERLETLQERALQDINGLVLATRHLEEAAKADKETAKATAKALAEAEQSRRDRGVARWTPIQRFLAFVGGSGAVASWIYLFIEAH